VNSRHLFLLASARKDGNTERLASVAAAGLPAGAAQEWLRLSDTPLPPFRDIRHDAGIYPAPTGHEKLLVEATLQATDLIFCAPVYWYGLPASAKLYLDYWSAWLRVPGLDFKNRMKGKRLWAVTMISGGDDATADPLIGTLKLTAEYMAMEWRGVLLGHGSRPGDVEKDARALRAAENFFKRASPASPGAGPGLS
jgi:multimeric flavodoxin WrbA